MAEIRLNTIIKQFNIGLDTLVDYLNSLGAGIDNAAPNLKISDKYLPALQRQFGEDYELNEASGKVGVTITDILGKPPKKPQSPSLLTNKLGRKGIRLGKIMEDLDIGLTPLLGYLSTLGHSVEANPNAQIPRSLYPLILREYINEIRKTDTPDDSLERREVINKKPKVIVDPLKIEFQKVVENNIVEGVVTAIGPKTIVINIGSPKKGILPADELKYRLNLEVGDKVEVFVDGSKDRKGRPLISHRKVLQLRSWDKVYSAFKRGDHINGYVIRRKKGGLVVDLKGFQAFLPNSHVETKPIHNYNAYIGKWMKFKILTFDSESRHVVVSRQAVLDPDFVARKSEFISSLEEGQVLEGTVKRVTGNGIFVDLEYADGFIHISEMNRDGHTNPKEMISEGQKIDVVVLSVDMQKQHINLGLKQAF